MDAQGGYSLSSAPKAQPFLRGELGKLDAAVAGRVAAAAGDIALIIDREGVIRDIAFNSDDLLHTGASAWLGQRWLDTVTVDSRHKVDELLRDAVRHGRTQWRELNQLTPTVNSLIIRYIAVDTGREGHVIAIGRDDRATEMMQERLIEAQQTMERDYARLRDAEFRYRLLFQMSAEAVIIVDAGARKIIEANPAAKQIVGEAGARLVGESFAKMFDPASQEDALSLLGVAQSTARTSSAQVRLSVQGREFLVSASLFREGRATQCLVRLSPSDEVRSEAADLPTRLQTVAAWIPDAFLVTDSALIILMANTSFLDMVRIPTQAQMLGQSLGRFLGRAGLERNILIDNLRAHGSVRNFSTILRDQFDEPEDVEISAVSVSDGAETYFGFTIRSVRRRAAERAPGPKASSRSVEQLTELVGRVKLKELVRESTDMVERLCIEAALELTKNNRASAAELLGLSRQSLYSKLHRFGLGNLADSDV
jgi:transcriptional regulator PpsR